MVTSLHPSPTHSIKVEFGGAPWAHYSGHLHAHTIALREILDHAQVVNDRSLMDFVKSGYEWTREFGIAEIGWVPEWTNNNFCEGCQISDVVALAIHLSDLCVGAFGFGLRLVPETKGKTLEEIAHFWLPQRKPDKSSITD